jgi:glycosyltransferase involved in cell wall biosynthesis
MTDPREATPWLSVVMPTYNGAAYLTDALGSISAQATEGVEVVAVDDGSTDDTVAILESYAAKLPVAVIREQHGGNWVATTNKGLGLARGRFVSFLHQDDMWMPGRLDAIRRELRRDGESGLILHSSWFIDERGKRLGRLRCPLPKDRTLPPAFVLERLLVQNFISIPSAVFPRELALEVGGLDEDLWYTADWDFWLRLAARTSTRYIARPLSAYRLHPEAQTSTRSVNSVEFRHQHEAVLARHLDPTNDRIKGAARLSIDMNVTLAAAAHGQRPQYSGLVRGFLALGPVGWWRYLHYSRVVERAQARIRAR